MLNNKSQRDHPYITNNGEHLKSVIKTLHLSQINYDNGFMPFMILRGISHQHCLNLGLMYKDNRTE